MKTERRHELQTNQLANWLGHYVELAKQYQKGIVATVLLIVAAAVAGTVISQQQATRARAGWKEYFLAFGDRSAQELGTVAESYIGSVASAWAKQAEADIQLGEGIDQLYRDRSVAKETLQRAKNSYLAAEIAANGLPSERDLKERAWFGLARVHESLAEVEKAREYYDKIAKSSPQSALGKESQRRATELNDPATEKWYNWFTNQTPRPRVPPGGIPAMPNLPDLENLPDRPDIPFSANPTTPAGSASIPGADTNPPANTSPLPSTSPVVPSESPGTSPAAPAPESAAPATPAGESTTTPESTTPESTPSAPASTPEGSTPPAADSVPPADATNSN